MYHEHELHIIHVYDLSLHVIQFLKCRLLDADITKTESHLKTMVISMNKSVFNVYDTCHVMFTTA